MALPRSVTPSSHTLQYRINIRDAYSFATFSPLVELLNLVRLLILLYFGTLVQLIYTNINNITIKLIVPWYWESGTLIEY